MESAVKAWAKDKDIGSMNEFAQTNLDKGVADSAPEAPVCVVFLKFECRKRTLYTIKAFLRPHTLSYSHSIQFYIICLILVRRSFRVYIAYKVIQFLISSEMQR